MSDMDPIANSDQTSSTRGEPIVQASGSEESYTLAREIAVLKKVARHSLQSGDRMKLHSLRKSLKSTRPSAGW
jgi:hypothetical protein